MVCSTTFFKKCTFWSYCRTPLIPHIFPSPSNRTRSTILWYVTFIYLKYCLHDIKTKKSNPKVSSMFMLVTYKLKKHYYWRNQTEALVGLNAVSYCLQVTTPISNYCLTFARKTKQNKKQQPFETLETVLQVYSLSWTIILSYLPYGNAV